jgi:hypothetical protein
MRRFVFFQFVFLSLSENPVELCTLAGLEPVKITINRDKLMDFKKQEE